VNVQSSIVTLILSSGPVAKAILALLLVASVFSWAIIIYKIITFQKVNVSTRRFLSFFPNGMTLARVQKGATEVEGPMPVLAKTVLEKAKAILGIKNGVLSPLEHLGLSVKIKDLERISQSVIEGEIIHLENYLYALATIGNTAPFVGLFGTVWGIMDAFHEIGLHEAPNIAVVAPGVAEALIATAAGLFVAIPAVVAYNLLVKNLKNIEGSLQAFSGELLTLIEGVTFGVSSQVERPSQAEETRNR